MITTKAADINAYISGFPSGTQQLLQQMRAAVTKAAPAAVEKISYGMPTFYLQGNLVHFAGYKNHIGFYPGPPTIKFFAARLSKYKSAKGSVQFPLDRPLPLSLIEGMVKYSVDRQMEKIKLKKPAKAAKA